MIKKATSLIGALILSSSFLLHFGQAQSTSNPTIIDNTLDGKLQNRSESPIEFELVQTFGTENGDPLYFTRRTGFAVDEEGNIYFFDEDLPKLIAVKPDGTIKWRVGREGRGPGDFLNPSGLAVGNGFIYAGNESRRRIDKYSLDGQFISSYTLPKELFGSTVEAIINEYQLVLSKSIRQGFGEVIIIVDLRNDYKVISQFDINITNGLENIPERVNSSPGVRIYNSTISGGSVTDHSHTFYDLNGQLTKKIQVDVGKIEPPTYSQIGGQRSISDGSLVSPAIVFSEDYYLVQALLKYKSGSKFFLNLFSKEGKLLYSEEKNSWASGIGHIFHVDNKGYIYAFGGTRFPQIRKYKVRINE